MEITLKTIATYRFNLFNNIIFNEGGIYTEMNERENNTREARPGTPVRGNAGGLRGRTSRRRPKFCYYCVEKQEQVDYKDVEKLRKYISERGKIIPRRVTGNCAKHQRLLTEAIKRARYMALLPYSLD